MSQKGDSSERKTLALRSPVRRSLRLRNLSAGFTNLENEPRKSSNEKNVQVEQEIGDIVNTAFEDSAKNTDVTKLTSTEINANIENCEDVVKKSEQPDFNHVKKKLLALYLDENQTKITSSLDSNDVEITEISSYQDDPENSKIDTKIEISEITINGFKDDIKSDVIHNVGEDVDNRRNLSSTLPVDNEGDLGRSEKQKNESYCTDSLLNSKIDELILNVSDISSNESNIEQNPFLETMAEDGEEDTPSEGSNDIIHVGEEINTTESDRSTNDSYDKNSFIDDDEKIDLLSGEEYDLSFEKNKRKKRIIDLDCDSDDDIIIITRPEKKKRIKRKKSRIIKFRDSSSEEEVSENNVGGADQDVNLEGLSELSETTKNGNDIFAGETNEEQTSSNVPILTTISETTIEKQAIKSVTEEDQSGKSDEHFNASQIVNSAPEDGVNKKIVILENIKVQDICNKDLSSHISNVINSLFSGINNSSEISVNLSVNCSDDLDESLLEHNEHKQRQGENIPPLPANNSQSAPTCDSQIKRKKRKKKKRVLNKTQNICSDTSEKILEFKFQSEKYKNENSSTSENTKKRKLSTSSKDDYRTTDYKTRLTKRRKKKRQITEFTNDNSRLPLLKDIAKEEAKVCLLQTDFVLNKGWNVQQISLATPHQPQRKTKHEMKSTKSQNIFTQKFHPKDFRNSVLYDHSRIKRITTKQLIRKQL